MARGEATHRPVLLEETLDGLSVQADGDYIDATYGRGGHAAAIAARLGPHGRLLLIDRDPAAVADARARHADDPRVTVEQGDFARLGELAGRHRGEAGFGGILMDLGVSSPQLDDPGRGFSFSHDGPLDMRMDPAAGESAADWLARVEAGELERVLRELGEERFARRIARAVVRARVERPLATTRELAELIAAAVPSRERDRHPATRSFQAIRMHINGELESLDAALAAVPQLLGIGGRLAVISFHSLEDRRVKRFIRRAEGRAEPPPRDARGQVLPVAANEPAGPRLRPVGRPVTPSDAECANNPRARSARLRIAERAA